jgi:hypothetical protein
MMADEHVSRTISENYAPQDKPVSGDDITPSQEQPRLPDYGAYHATLIADPALPGKWQPGEEVVSLLVVEG